MVFGTKFSKQAGQTKMAAAAGAGTVDTDDSLPACVTGVLVACFLCQISCFLFLNYYVLFLDS